MLRTSSSLRFKARKSRGNKIKKREINEEREPIPCCSLVLCVFPGPGGALSHLCLRRQVLPQLPLLGFPTPSLSLKMLFFFPFAASAFFSFPQPLLHCLPSSFHTLIACISHRSPLANCIILMVFFMITLCGKLTFHAAY